MNRTARSIEELFPIIGYTRAGDLKSVQAWIEAGSPLNLPPGKKTRRQSPLQIAIDKGFLTLTEMLLDGGADPRADDALGRAIYCHRTDIAKLLLDRGVPLDDVSFADVCEAHDLDLIRLFLDRGADVLSGEPFYQGLIGGLQPLIGFFKELLAKDSRLQPQADAALLHYVESKNPRGVALMMWAGARPDAELGEISDETRETPLESAVRVGDLATVKSMKPEKYPQLLPRMMKAAGAADSDSLVDYLLSLGAPLNDQDDGSSSLLYSLLWSIEWDSDTRYGLYARNPAKVDEHIARIDELLGKGAKFPSMEIRDLRRRLSSVAPEKTVRLLRVLRERNAFSTEFLMGVISTPKMREVLKLHWQKVAEVITGPKTKPENPNTAEISRSAPKPLLPIAELRERAESQVIKFLVGYGHLHFTRGEFVAYWTKGEFRRRLRMPPEDERDERELFKRACETIASRLRSADLAVDAPQDCSSLRVCFRLHPTSTWTEVLREASGSLRNSPLPLSQSAERLFALYEAGELVGRWFGRQQLAKRLGASRWGRFEQSLCEELSARRQINLATAERMKEEEPREVEISFSVADTEQLQTVSSAPALPPFEWNRPIENFGKSDLDEFRLMILQAALDLRPEGKAPLYLFRIRTLADLAARFPRVQPSHSDPGGELAAFLRAVRFPIEISIAFDLQDTVVEWWAALVPKNEWAQACAAIEHDLNKPSLEQRFGLSYDAARLLEWILALRPDDMLGPWSPVVEDRLKSEIGVRAEWPGDNLPALFQMLIDEINAKTDQLLSLQPWNEQGRTKSRIKVGKKPAENDTLETAVRRWAAGQGIVPADEKVSAALAVLSRTLRDK